MSNVLIYGTDRLAFIAYWNLVTDSPHTVVGFIRSRRFAPGRTPEWGRFERRPVLPQEELEREFPPESDIRCFAPRPPRERRGAPRFGGAVLKRRGYKFITYRSSRANIAGDAVIGDNCMILEGVTIQPFVRIGDHVTLSLGCHVGHHTTIADSVYVAPHAVIEPGSRIESDRVLKPSATLGVR